MLICIPFNKEFAAISADAFVEDILIGRIGMKAMVVGGDYSFGRNREGNLDFLRKRSGELGFELIIADWIQPPNAGANGARRISSTRIREFVEEGNMADARKMLGRDYQIRGEVIKGRDRGGKLLNCPTANILLQDELTPKTGVYAVTVECDGQKRKGVANIGYSPTFDDYLYTVEVHILDFDQRIYGDRIRVNFVERIRDEKKFSGLPELSEQIKKDIEYARQTISL